MIGIWILSAYPLWGQFMGAHSIEVTVTIPEVAIIDLAPNTSTINMRLQAPLQAGDPIDLSDAYDDSKWINYSASLPPGGAKKNITAQIVSGSVPKGFELKLKASSVSGGKGKKGKPTGQITLSANPQTIIYNIGGGYTGRGVYNGHQIEFKLTNDQYADIEFGESTIVVVFTLTDN